MLLWLRSPDKFFQRPLKPIIENKTHENPRNFSFPTRNTLVQQAGKMNIKNLEYLRELDAFGDWSFGDWSRSEIGRISGNSGIGRSENGRSKIGRSEIGRSEIGRSKIGRSEIGRSENGHSEIGRCTVISSS
jgi:hypothetical protein